MELTRTNIKISPIDMGSRAKLGIKAGDTIRVTSKIQEKGKTRLQAFEGLVIAVKHGNEAGGSFTVRKVASGVGMEKTFALYSPLLEKIEIVRRSKTRRAKIYYIRDKTARDIRRKMKSSSDLLISTDMLKEEEKSQVEPESEEGAAPAEEEAPENTPEEVEEEIREEEPAEEGPRETKEEVTPEEAPENVKEDETKPEDVAKDEKK
jgi:large subunit ribosomal protein L19